MNENIGLLVRDSLDSLTEGATAPAWGLLRARAASTTGASR